jgi:hypothetical protein
MKTFNQHRKQLQEGGNARATNKQTGMDTLAQKIPLKDIGRAQFIKKFIEVFEEIDRLFEKKYGYPLWENKKILKNGVAFNGSTSFIMNPELADDAVIPYKPTAGDIDIMVPHEYKADLWHLLDDLESNPHFMKDVEYRGCNKLSVSSIGEQINSVFQVTFGENETQSQVDFEFTAFENGEPDMFARFSHSSSLADAQQGFKGVNHKYLLRSIVGGASKRDDVLILLKSGTYEKPKFKKTKGEPLTTINVNKFSVVRGLRTAYEPVMVPGTNDHWVHDGKHVYRELPSKGSSYETAIESMFQILFNERNSKDLQKMWSFVGVVELMKKYLDKKGIATTFERYLEVCWGPAGQPLERDDKNIDAEIKFGGVNHLIDVFPWLKKYEKHIKDMTDEYYANYGRKRDR